MPLSPSSPPGDPDRLLEALDPEQRQVALALRGPVRVLAGAGTGKTRAITHRIAYGVATGVFDPRQVLAVTFTTRAAGEMRARLRSLGAPGVQARTFHSAALRQARFFWPRVHGSELPDLMDSKLGLVGAAARRNRVETQAATLRDLASEIEWAKVSNVGPDTYAQVAAAKGREVGVDAATVARVFASYEEAKREAGRMDMEDILLAAASLLAEDDRVAAQVRGQYHHLVVDEFQDVSPLQATLLDLWLGGRHDVCVVGDPAQTIYSFAGAHSRYLLDFPKRHPGTTSIELVRNYRSTPQIVSTANAVLARGDTGGVTLRAQRPAGAAVAFREHSDEVDEAEAAAADIKARVDAGRAASSMAVLVRINAQTEAFEEALAARGVPYLVRGGERFFARPEVRQAVTLLRGSARAAAAPVDDPRAPEPSGAASLPSGTGDAPDAAGGDDDGGETLADQVRAVLAGMGWTPQAPTARGSQRDRWESLQALVGAAAAFAAERRGADLAALVDDLDRRSAEQHAPTADGVTIATLHAAKGLEWDSVHLAGVVEGTLPISFSLDSPAAVEEERRLLYVGMTRAREELTVSWALARSPGGRATRRPSRFLDDVRPQVASDRTRETSRARKRGVAACRVCGASLGSVAERRIGRCEGCPSSYDEALFERLRTWRMETAKAESVPAYVVFTDLTLQAIAEVRPTTHAQLLAINGIGKAKQEKYADAVLELVAAGAVEK